MVNIELVLCSVFCTMHVLSHLIFLVILSWPFQLRSPVILSTSSPRKSYYCSILLMKSGVFLGHTAHDNTVMQKSLHWTWHIIGSCCVSLCLPQPPTSLLALQQQFWRDHQLFVGSLFMVPWGKAYLFLFSSSRPPKGRCVPYMISDGALLFIYYEYFGSGLWQNFSII